MEELKSIMQNTLCWLTSLYTASELKIMALASAFGAFFSACVGGVDQQVQALIYLVIVDYITGVAVSIKTKQFGSAKGFRGLLKKATIFAVITFAYFVDLAMGIKMLRAMAIFGFAAVEATSVIENVDRLGYGQYIPAFVRDKLVQIREEKGVV